MLRVEDVVMEGLVEEVERGFAALRNDVMSQLLFISLHGDDVDANIQSLGQS